MEQKRGFAHPRLRDQGEESEVRFNTVEQRCKSFAMRRTEIQEAWIGGDPEWLFPKAKEFQKHKYRAYSHSTCGVRVGHATYPTPWLFTSRLKTHCPFRPVPSQFPSDGSWYEYHDRI